MSKIAYLFPGQGSQAVGMGLDLASNCEAAGALLKSADDVLAEIWDDCAPRLSALISDGPEDILRQTIYAQPALYTCSAMAMEALRQAGARPPQAVAGHSVGEYAALLAAGVFDFETGLRLVARRAIEMQRAATDSVGTMAAVLGLEPEAVVDICAAAGASSGAIVDAANFNAPGQIVISGAVEGVEAASVLAKERGAKRVLPLVVSGAFHSRLMKPAADAMRDAIKEFGFADPKIVIVANLTADYVLSGQAAKDALVDQIEHPVRWQETIERLTSDGYDTFVEVGYGKVLSGMMKRMAPDATVLQAGTPDDVAAVAAGS